MTPTDGTAHVDAEGEPELGEFAHLAVPQPTSNNCVERTQIALDEIYVPRDRRALQPDKVADLAQSMKVLGLLSPVGVRWVRKEIILPNALTVKGAYHLVYGLYRLTAARQLGWKEIPCQILFSSTAAIENPYSLRMQGGDRHALMVEIAENLHRAELTALERSERIAALPDKAKAEAKELGLDNNQVALLKATRAGDPVNALRDHATLCKEAPLPPAQPSATVSADEPKPQGTSAELAVAMEAVKKLSPEDLSAFVWWVRAKLAFRYRELRRN